MADSSIPVAALRDAQDEQSIWGIIYNALAELTRLEIKTVVTGDGSSAQMTLYTCINLLQADRTSQIDKGLVTDSALGPVRDFHAEQVRLAVQDLQQRLDFVQKLAAAAIDAMRRR